MSARSVGRVTSVGLLLMLALWLVVGGCVREEEEAEGGSQKESDEEPLIGNFVGEIPEADAFVALVAQEPGEGGDQREVRAYLCDGRSINEWFDEGSAEKGLVEGTELDLTSDNGAELISSLRRDVDSSWMSGNISLADGTLLPFGAPPVTGIAGLYEVTIIGSQLSGTSHGGGQLEGRLGETLQEDDLYPLSGTVTPPDGKPPQDFQAFATPDASDELRVIVLEDGRIKGGFKRDEGAGFVGQDTTLK